MRRSLTIVLLASLAGAAAMPGVAADTAPTAVKVINQLKLGGTGGWDYLSFDAQRRHLFVSRGDRVLVIDVDSDKQIGTIPNTNGVHGIAVAQDLHRGFTSNGKSNSVTVFDLDTLKTVSTIAGTGEKPDAILYDSASHHVFTFNGKSGTASVIDPAKNAVAATIALPGKPEFSATDDSGHVFVNIEDKSELAEIDSSTNKVLHVWSLAPCESPSGLAMDVAHKRLFSVCDNRTMTVLDANNGHRVATVAIGDGPDAVTFDAGDNTVYSSNGESGTLTVVHEDDPDHYTVVANVPTLVSARTQALDPQKHRIYLSSAQIGTGKEANGRPKYVPDSFAILTVGKP
ncbi:YncE family protein [Dyella psychrodurans]|uniref:YncE family protein n=1 Tax=Dyella psychrodurans TaxID=1927960 RepID=A0A370XDP4_9GAMM|nr:YncE family protein [Dyella psychrodurans]RDS86390.1 YncE family protein [Dyella psychrodurans]